MVRMKSAYRLLALLLPVLACGPAGAQRVAADYRLVAPPPLVDPEFTPHGALATFGPLRFAKASSTTGSGLSLEAGERWFARAGIGHSLDVDVMSVGGGYRFTGGEALSMHLTRQLGQERLGLAVRYDWSRTYLRLSYEAAPRPANGPDRLRFSAGLSF
jgi:hypothetical protein